MDIINYGGWIFYINGKPEFDPNKVGKWMCFFKNGELDFVSKKCNEAVEKHIVEEAKHSSEIVLELKGTGVACFYLHCDDIEAHKRVLSYLLENNLINRTKKGRLYNISFKLDKQTQSGEYGEDFHSNIKLENYIDLDTEEWIV